MLKNIMAVSRMAADARARTGKSRLSQFLEILKLRLSPRALGLTEYYDLRLFDDSLYGGTSKASFIGRRYSTFLDRSLNASHSRVLANDKVITYALLARFGFPIPLTHAIFNRKGRFIGDEKRLATLEDVRAFLRFDAPYPVFVKPVCGTYGRGALGISAYLQDSDQFRLLDGTLTGMDELLADFEFEPYDGKLLQEVLIPHGEIAEITGPRISCIRVIVVVVGTIPRIHTAFWKVVAGSNMTDNFSLGRHGNLIAAVDVKTGTVGNTIGGLGPAADPVVCHPTTGRTLQGFRLPHWDRVVELCLAVAPHFPGLCLQNWDVAICEDGPVLMEVNTEADLGIPQAVTHSGMLNELMLDALRARRK